MTNWPILLLHTSYPTFSAIVITVCSDFNLAKKDFNLIQPRTQIVPPGELRLNTYQRFQRAAA